MALTYVRLRVAKDLRAPPKRLRVLVDTGATYTMLPARALKGLGVVPAQETLVRLADGRRVRRKLGVAVVRYRSFWTPTWVMFGERGDASVLGALTLEELSLQVDPLSQRLREVKVALLVAGRASGI